MECPYQLVFPIAVNDQICSRSFQTQAKRKSQVVLSTGIWLTLVKEQVQWFGQKALVLLFATKDITSLAFNVISTQLCWVYVNSCLSQECLDIFIYYYCI